MKEVKHVRVLNEEASQFRLTLPKHKVLQMFKPAEDNKFYAKVDFEDSFIRVSPLEIVEENEPQDLMEELKQLGLGGENADGS